MAALTKCRSCGTDVAKSAKTCPKCGAPLRMGFLKKVGIGFGVLVVLAFLGNLGKGTRTESRAASPGPATATEPAVTDATPAEPAEPVLQVSITQLLRDYKSNEVGADGKYKGKTIQVTGKVGEIKKDIMGSIFVTLGTGAQFEIPEVQAFFDDDWAGKAAQLSHGQKLTIRGRVDGLMMNVLVKDSEIVQ